MSDLITENLPLIATAPDGIKRLRGLILELAVCGKLVPQDPNDEPARELRERIEAEKARLVKEGKIPKLNALEAVEEQVWPFAVPIGWEWVNLGRIAIVERGGSPRPIKSFLTNDHDGLNWIKISDTDIGGKYITSAKEKIKPEGLSSSRKVFPGDFLLTNSMSFGRPYITTIEGCIHDGWLRISPPESLNKDYLYTLLSSPFVRRLFIAAAAGAVVMNLNADKVRYLPIPLPPLPEQHRIVARVDELMALCDRLEAEQTDAAEAHARLVDALLATLTTSRNPAECTAHWQRLSEHFDTLFTTEASIAALKQTVLQLAVMGRLVPQDPTDEPANELLKRIEAEKARLVKEGKIRKPKEVEAVGEDERPFEMPAGWGWCRFDQLINPIKPISYGVLVPGPDQTGGVPFVRLGDLSLTDPQHLPEKSIDPAIDAQYARTRLDGGEILMGVVGSIGKLGVAPDSWRGANIARAICRISPTPLISKEYLVGILQSDFMRSGFLVDTRTLAQPTLNVGLIRLAPTPLPPLPEQHRIVDKVDELMALCDRLQADLHNARASETRIAEAITTIGYHSRSAETKSTSTLDTLSNQV